jgi:hypothetical protein
MESRFAAVKGFSSSSHPHGERVSPLLDLFVLHSAQFERGNRESTRIFRRILSVLVESLHTRSLERKEKVRTVHELPLQSAGRIIRIKIVGSYAVTFWADHAAREIKITDIRSADHA